MNKDVANIEDILNSSQLLRAINTMDEVGITITDPNLYDNPIVYTNRGFEKITGYTSEEVLLVNCRFLQGEDTDRVAAQKITMAIKELRTETVIIKNYRKDGTYFWNQFSISPIINSKGKLINYIGFQFDVTKQIEKEENSRKKINSLTHYDQLTGLLNQNTFKEKLNQFIEIAKKQKKKYAILRVNLNGFRYINESYGEKVGDTILIEVARRLKTIFNEDALLSRSYADDFAIVLKDISNNKHINQMITFLENCLTNPYKLDGENVYINYSIGVSRFPQDGNSATVLLKNAELAMKEIKTNHSTNHYFFHYELLEKVQERLAIEQKFEQAYTNEEFELYFQPKISPSKIITGLEALIRWNDPILGIINPGKFIPIAEETGFILKLGPWVLLKACQINKQWQDKGYEKIPISVNVSAIQFRHPLFLQVVKDILEETKLEPQYLELEITESIFTDPMIVIDKLNELKNIGVSISIDDFGTGYSSINYLKVLPVDTIKIDRAFVQDVPSSPKESGLLSSIIQLGKSLSVSVLTEGVETEEQFDFLSVNGCDYIQGYYFSRPVRSNEMEHLLSKTS